MSHNGVRFSPMMANGELGTAYGYAAGSSAEGDIMADVNPLSAEVGLEHGGQNMGVLDGLREDDSNLRMGGSYAPRAEGSVEGDRGWPLNEQPTMGVSAYDRLEGLREDDADLRLGGAGDAGSGAVPDAEGSAEGLRVEQMGSILVSDGRSGGMIGVSAYDKLGVSAYDVVMNGLREDDADLRMGGLREEDADINLSMRGLREDDADLRMGGLRESDADIRLRMGVSAYDRLELGGLREDDAGLRIGSVRAAMMLRSLADPEGVLNEMGRRRASFVRRMHRRKRKMGAEDFHPRFPAVMIEGMGTMDGIFDFLKPDPTPEEYMGKVKVVLDGWNVVKPQLMALPEQSRNAIMKQMNALGTDPYKYDGLAQFLAEGYAGYKASPGRWDRVKRLEAYLPTVQAMVSQARALGPAQTPAEEEKRATEAAIKNVDIRTAAVEKPSFIQEAAPYAAGAIGAGAIIGLILAVS